MFTEKMKDLRQSRGLNKRQMAEILELPYTTYNNYEIGAREPNSDILKKISKIFGVSVDFLIDNSDFIYGNVNLMHPQITEDTVTFPVIGTIAAGYDSIAVEDWSGETVEIPTSYLKGRKKEEYFVLSVSGNSMYPLYMDGDKVLILRQSTLDRSGDIGAIMYEGENATLKKVEYVNGEDWLKLIPINPEYQPKTIEGVALEQCRVLGVPRLLIREI
ncbi:MAG: helix-turn-helix domain-containing protein [Oscillospiraceae bacterium]|nr:helix-turn-helix domain-containing protein [Oscillospiraceae bacterium]